eukprot:SAG11_NODE_3_length_39220_cov_67.005828_24_plen_129_part_00
MDMDTYEVPLGYHWATRAEVVSSEMPPRPLLDPSSTPPRPFLDPSSTPPQPLFDPFDPYSTPPQPLLESFRLAVLRNAAESALSQERIMAHESGTLQGREPYMYYYKVRHTQQRPPLPFGCLDKLRLG